MTATLSEPIRAALKAGWRVDNPEGPVATVYCPDGAHFSLPLRASSARHESFMRTLEQHGLTEALAAAEGNRERTTARVIAQRDGERAEQEIERAEQAKQAAREAAALRRATVGSGYFIEPETVPLVEIMAPHPAPKVYRVLITSPMAQVMLGANTRNRKPRASDVTFYGGAMQQKVWLLTHQPIAFDVNGVLIDGQQRLMAIVESGVPADLFIMCGMPPESFDVVDTHRKRTAGDLFFGRGEAQVSRLAAVCRLVWVFDHDPQGSWRNRVSNHTLGKVLDANPEIRQAINRAHPIAKATRGNHTAMSAGVYLLWRAMSPEHPQVQAFLEGVETGANLDGGDPRLRLARTTQTAVDRRVTRDSQRQLALWLKGWRAFALDRKVGVLVWRKDEKFPGVFVVQPEQPSHD